MIPPSSSFVERLLRLNGLGGVGFAGWDFRPGMRFGERAAWWRDGAGRPAPHEGLDLWRFRTRDGGLATLGAGARVPPLWAGEVAAVLDDFLGRSVFLAHDRTDAAGRRLLSAYGHVVPPPGLAPGTALGEDDEIGTVADPRVRGRAVPAHLHLTVALVAGGPAGLDWRALRDTARALLVDPLLAVSGGGGTFLPAQA